MSRNISINSRANANLIFNALSGNEKFIKSGLTLSSTANRVLLVGPKGLQYVTAMLTTEISSRSMQVEKYTVHQSTRIQDDGTSYSRVEVTF